MVPVFPGQSRFYELYTIMSWCPAKFGIGHQLSQGCPSRKKYDISSDAHESCYFPTVGESVYSR